MGETGIVTDDEVMGGSGSGQTDGQNGENLLADECLHVFLRLADTPSDSLLELGLVFSKHHSRIDIRGRVAVRI